MSIEIAEYDEFRAKLNEVKEACSFIPDVSTDEGYKKSRRISLDVGKVLTALEKARKDKKAHTLELGRAIDSDAKRIAAELEGLQLPHKAAYKELDNLKKEREQRRKDDLDDRVRTIRELPEAMQDSDSSGLKMALESLQEEECLDFYEFTEQALKARNASKESLAKMFAEKLKQEKDAAELAELRKKQAEQEQKDRDERIAKEAAAQAEQEAADAKAAEQRVIDLAAAAVRQRDAAEAEAKRQAKLAEERRIEAEAQAKIAAEQAAENARVQAAVDQKAKEAAEQAENEKREANKKHVGKIRKEAKESLMALGIDEAMAKKVVLAIHNGDIKNVSINY